MYAGCPGSGRRTSLCAAAAVASAEGEVRFRWGAGASACEVVARAHGMGPAHQVEERALLARADAVVFVVDPRRDRLAAGEAALAELREALAAVGRDPDGVAMVFQLNKLDLPLDGSGAAHFAEMTGWRGEALGLVRAPLATLRRLFRSGRCDYAETIATAGIGVHEALARALAPPGASQDRVSAVRACATTRSTGGG
ncbi:MAG: hypothetical protein HY744_11200 [Deltaproteobacteria bacterium]|nr:hypothetical protein [Deltaproteobacteria bacterium]